MWNDHITENDELRDDRSDLFITWVEHEINTLKQKLDWWQEEENDKKDGKQSASLLLIRSTAMQMKQNLLQILQNQEK